MKRQEKGFLYLSFTFLSLLSHNDTDLISTTGVHSSIDGREDDQVTLLKRMELYMYYSILG